MIILFTIGILLGVISVVFVLQNVDIVTVTFFSWHFNGSLALVLFLTFTVGIFVTILLILPESINNYLKNKKIEKENEKLKEELRKQKELTTFAKNVSPTEL
jgi:uncharacterized integral membrane protein